MKNFKFVLFFLLNLLVFSINSISEKICIIGSSYVGLVTGACLADFGNKVICADCDEHKIKILQSGKIPIYEDGLQEIVNRSIENGYLFFTSNITSAIQESDIIFIAVGTPMKEDGSTDLSAVEDVARLIGENLTSYKLICTKSTVPIGTGHKIARIIQKYNKHGFEFDIISNPEFLKEGCAVKDFLYPQRIVIGTESERVIEKIKKLYYPFIEKNVPIILTNLNTAETIKYVCNSFLGMKVAFINEIVQLCEKVDANIDFISKAMGLDDRIGSKFLNPGPGFGGSCFPKDISELLYKSKSEGIDLRILAAAYESNELHKEWIFNTFSRFLDNNLKDKKIAVLGLAFKANTDDVRNSPAITILQRLLEAGVKVNAYDPKANENMRKIFPQVNYSNSAYEALDKTNGMILLTEWQEFCSLDWNEIFLIMEDSKIFDCRNLLDEKKLKKIGFKFRGIGKAS